MWLERPAPVRCPGVLPGVRMREARRLRNGLARDATATIQAGIPQNMMFGSLNKCHSKRAKFPNPPLSRLRERRLQDLVVGVGDVHTPEALQPAEQSLISQTTLIYSLTRQHDPAN